MRIDRPIGIWLLLLPGLWSIALASGGIYGLSLHSLWIALLFAAGAVLMRGAGCVINDLWDRDLDKQVERTRLRPLASGTLSARRALVFLLILLFLSLLILLQFNNITIILGLVTIPLIVNYPLMKRITWWPQAFLGITFNFAVLMGWGAVQNDLSISAVLIYIGGIFWTLAYDTIYAHQDKDDDLMAGIKSTALRFGHHSKFWVLHFFIAAMMFFIGAGIAAKGLSLWCLVFVPACIHILWLCKIWNPDSPESSLSVFKASRNTGFLLLIAFLLYM